jgi:hypothetical protein
MAELRKAVGDPAAEFREGQWEAIDALVNQRKRLLVVQRTGWGKSAVYFIATRLLRDRGAGPTLIVSPLLALMRNQLEAAERLGIDARKIDSTNLDEWPEHRAAIAAGRVDACHSRSRWLVRRRSASSTTSIPTRSAIGSSTSCTKSSFERRSGEISRIALASASASD